MPAFWCGSVPASRDADTQPAAHQEKGPGVRGLGSQDSARAVGSAGAASARDGQARQRQTDQGQAAGFRHGSGTVGRNEVDAIPPVEHVGFDPVDINQRFALRRAQIEVHAYQVVVGVGEHKIPGCIQPPVQARLQAELTPVAYTDASFVLAELLPSAGFRIRSLCKPQGISSGKEVFTVAAPVRTLHWWARSGAAAARAPSHGSNGPLPANGLPS